MTLVDTASFSAFAPVSMRVLLSIRISPLKTAASLAKLWYWRNINSVYLFAFPLTVESSPKDKYQANVVSQSSGSSAVLSHTNRQCVKQLRKACVNTPIFGRSNTCQRVSRFSRSENINNRLNYIPLLRWLLLKFLLFIEKDFADIF